MRRTATLVTLLLMLSLCAVAVVRANNGTDGEEPAITISPKTLILSSDVPCVTVHSNIAYGLVNPASLELEGVAPYLVKRDALGDLVAKFHSSEIMAVVEPGLVTLTLTGDWKDGKSLSLEDTIVVRE